MTDASMMEKAERLSRKRAMMLPFLAVIYLTQQASFFSGDAPPGDRSVDYVKAGAWLVLSAALLMAIATNGFWLQSKEMRSLIDDEVTRAHRLEAMRVGFIASMLGAIALYVLAMFEPVTGREAVHLVLSLGLGAALVRFGLLERRAHRLG